MSEIAELQQEGDAKRDSESVHDTIEWLPGLLMGDEDSLLAFENESGLDIEEEPLSADLSLDSMPSSTQLVRSTGYDSTCISLLSIAQPRSTTRRPAWPPKRSTPKQRLDLLRAQVERLTQELANLKVAAGLGLTAPVVRVPVAAAGVDTPALTSTPNLHLWEKLAARQLNHRRNVEDENKALRQAIVLQYRRVKHLRQLFAKLTRSDNSSLPFASVLPQATMCSCQISRKVLPTCLPDDESVFETLAVDMDELYAGVGDTFWCAKMNEIEPQGRTSSSSRIDPDAWIIEFRDVHVLPFDFRDTARAVWRLETCRSSPNTAHEIKRSFQLPYEHSSGTLKIQQRRLVRRYHEAERTVLIIRQLSQPMPDVLVYTTTQMVIKNGPKSVSSPTTVIETHLKSSGYASAAAQQIIFDMLPHCQPAHRDDDLFAMNLWDRSISRTHDSIESLLVAEAATFARTIQ